MALPFALSKIWAKMLNDTKWTPYSLICDFNTDVDVAALFWTTVLTGGLFLGAKTYQKVSEHLPQVWDEYGPIIIDTVLACPPVRAVRRLIIYFRNCLIARRGTPAILRLPDELLLDICQLVLYSDCPSAGVYACRCKGCMSSKRELASFSKVNKRMRQISAPLLLSTIRLGQGQGWQRASRTLRAVEMSVDAPHIAKSLHVDISAGHGTSVKLLKALPARLASVLLAFQKLQKLVLVIPEHHTEAFRRAFEAGTRSFPGIRTLVLGPHVEWIVPMCPNVEVISTHDRRWLRSDYYRDADRRHSLALIKAAGRAEKLRRFDMTECWDKWLVLATRESMPDLRSLAMLGDRYTDGLRQLLPHLIQFRKLRTLALADISALGIGYTAPRCGNALMGPSGDAARREAAKRRQEHIVHTVEMLFGRLKGLEELWIGDKQKATIVRSADGGKGEIVWSYEPRSTPSSEC